MDLIESHIGPMRDRYAELMAHPERIEEILQDGARRARRIATPFLAELREAVGLRPMKALPVTAQPRRSEAAKPQLPVFKQYREADGQFYFKLTAANGTVLLQSRGFAEGREAGGWVKRLKTEGAAALAEAPVEIPAGVAREDVEAALGALVAASEE